MTTPKQFIEEFEEKKEQLADIEHQRWADWQAHCHKKVLDGGGVFPDDLLNRWERQINTPYTHLSEQEKESDRKQVDRYFPLIKNYFISTIISVLKEQLEEVCCDGECYHDDCCGKISENCTHISLKSKIADWEELIK